MKSTIIIGAHDFIEIMPNEYKLVEPHLLKVPWLYNNTGLYQGSCIPSKCTIKIPQEGVYSLYVHSHGHKDSSFRVAINGIYDREVFGNKPFQWQKGEAYNLSQKAEVTVEAISSGSCFDVIVLTANPNFDPGSVNQESLPDDVRIMREYNIQPRSTVKFGDIRGDGTIGFAALERDYSCNVYDNAGHLLWRYQAPPLDQCMENRRSFEPPGVIWDIDQDGIGEVIHWRYINGQSWLTVVNGLTGEIKNKTEFPSVWPNAFYNYRLAIARLESGYPRNIIVFADSGGTISITAYSSDLTILWSHVEARKKDNLGHYIYPVDLTDNGLDDIVVGALALDNQGNVLWDRLCSDNHDHIDSMRFIDINGDGKQEIVAAYSDQGVQVLESSTGELIWQRPAHHTQQIEAGDFLTKVPQPQIAAGARIYNRLPGVYLSAQVYWYDKHGNLVLKWPSTPLNGNPDFVKGHWFGDERIQLFWYKFIIKNTGKGHFYFPEQVYHMFDFTGDGAEEVITIYGCRLRIYGSNKATRKPHYAKRDLDYMYRSVVNHTHY